MLLSCSCTATIKILFILQPRLGKLLTYCRFCLSPFVYHAQPLSPAVSSVHLHCLPFWLWNESHQQLTHPTSLLQHFVFCIGGTSAGFDS